MQDCSIFGLGCFGVIQRRRGRERERYREIKRKHSQNPTTPCRENISCVAGLQNMLPGF